MGTQNQTVECEARMGRFQIAVTVTVIDEIPPAGSVKKLLYDQGLHASWTH